MYLLYIIHLNISLVYTFCNLSLYDGLTFPWKIVGKEGILQGPH